MSSQKWSPSSTKPETRKCDNITTGGIHHRYTLDGVTLVKLGSVNDQELKMKYTGVPNSLLLWLDQAVIVSKMLREIN
jgi:hypothetical protein